MIPETKCLLMDWKHFLMWVSKLTEQDFVILITTNKRKRPNVAKVSANDLLVDRNTAAHKNSATFFFYFLISVSGLFLMSFVLLQEQISELH